MVPAVSRRQPWLYSVYADDSSGTCSELYFSNTTPVLSPEQKTCTLLRMSWKEMDDSVNLLQTDAATKLLLSFSGGSSGKSLGEVCIIYSEGEIVLITSRKFCRFGAGCRHICPNIHLSTIGAFGSHCGLGSVNSVHTTQFQTGSWRCLLLSLNICPLCIVPSWRLMYQLLATGKFVHPHRETNLSACSLNCFTRGTNWIIADAKIVNSCLPKICMHDYMAFTGRTIKH